MSTLDITVLSIYFGLLTILSIFGIHRLYLIFLFNWYKKSIPQFNAETDQDKWVTVQLPMYNEKYVAERLIDAACNLDYNKERLEIQVLDDSTDETIEIARARVSHWKKKGINIEYIRRPDRKGYKAGALEYGLNLALGEYIAVFDADFLPSKDFLTSTTRFFNDPKIGMVQVRWGHLNRNFSLLTRVQSLMLDGHFVIEHTARNRSGMFFNFNGTAGIWRRETIREAGGWQHDTLTEDLDLSYRAQIAGWNFVYLMDTVTPSELPVEMNAFKSQQHRWAKGMIQTAIKLLPSIWRSKLPFRVKSEATFHMTCNFAYPLVLIMGIFMLPANLIREKFDITNLFWIDLFVVCFATLSVLIYYIYAQKIISNLRWKNFLEMPMLMAVGIGMSVNNARAVLEAFLGKTGEFVRTPKYSVTQQETGWAKKIYRSPIHISSWFELLMALYMFIAIIIVAFEGHWQSIPFLLLFFTGFTYVGIKSIFQPTSR